MSEERGIWHITDKKTGEIICMTTYAKYATLIADALNAKAKHFRKV